MKARLAVLIIVALSGATIAAEAARPSPKPVAAAFDVPPPGCTPDCPTKK